MGNKVRQAAIAGACIMFLLMISAVASAQVQGLAISDTVYHQNDISIGKIQLENSTAVLATDLQLYTGQYAPVGNIDLATMYAHIKVMGYSVSNHELHVIGSVSNNGNSDVILNFFIETGKKGLEPGTRDFIGTIYVPAGSDMDMAPSARFERKLVQHLAYLAADQDLDSAMLYVKAIGKNGAKGNVTIEKIALKSAPVFHSSFIIDNNPDNSHPASAVVEAATFSGAIQNRGASDLRVVIVAGMDDLFGMSYDNGILADGSIEPGETADLSELLLEGTEYDMRMVGSESVFGQPVEIHMFLFSQSTIKARSQYLEMKTEVNFR